MATYYFSIFDILPYFVVLLLLIVISCMNTSDSKKATLCFIVLFLLAAIRYGIGYDYYSYLSYILQDREEYQYEKMEPFSLILLKIGYYTHYQFFYALGSLLTLYPVYLVCKKYSVNPALSLIVFYLHPSFYLAYLSIVRNGMAISFVFLAFIFLHERKILKSVLFLICACMFHKSAVIGVLIYPIFYFFNYRRLNLIAYLISFGLSLLVSRVITQYATAIELVGMAEGYMKRDAEGGTFMSVIINSLGVINLLLWGKIEKCGPGYVYYLAMSNIGICLWNIFLPLNYTMANRFCLFFLTPIILIIPCYSLVFPLEKRAIVKRLTYLFFISLFCSYFYINISGFLKSPGRMSSIPYQTVFFGKDYENLQ